MTIVIPSKHIYSKLFDPVIDNNIDRVEANIKNSYIENGNGNIYNERIESRFIAEEFIEKTNKNESIKDQQGRYWEVAIAEIYAVPTYITKTYAIPRTKNNRLVLSVLTGTDKYEDPNIQYSIMGDIEKGNSSGYITLLSPDYPYHSPMQFGIGESEINSSNITTETYKNYDLLKDEELLNYKYNYTSVFGNSRTVDVSIVLPKKTDVFTAQIDSEDENNYYLTFSILAGIEIYKLGGVAQVDIATESEKVVPINGIYENYIPKVVNVSFYGTYIQLNLEDETKIINVFGKDVFSFDGNELIQTTNTPSTESKYQSVIDKWKNGKQTAVITCPIADYYDENGNKVIDITTSGKMLFREGDIVIPYTYTNKGDKPLSYNRDFTPKKFKIMGVGISKRQGGMQELTLQEYYNPNEIKIEIGDILRGGGSLEIAYIEIFVIDGTVNEGDILVYKNEEAEVFSIEEDVIELRCETNGSFYNAIGTTITVTKL